MQARFGRGTLVFGAIGLVWAAQIASLLRVGCFAHDDGLAFIALPVLVPVAMSLLGCMLAWIVVAARSEGGLDSRPFLVTVVVPAMGLLVGVVAGLVWWPEQVPTAAAHGLAFGAAALVLLLPVIVMLQSSSRPRSLMDKTDRLAMWSYAGAIACMSSVLTLPQWKTYPTCESDPLQAIVATAASALVALAAGALLVLHVRRSRRLLAAHDVGWLRLSVDAGVGDGRSEMMSHPPTAYRHAASLLGVIHGDVAKAQTIMQRRARWAIVCAAMSLASASVGIASRLI